VNPGVVDVVYSTS